MAEEDDDERIIAVFRKYDQDGDGRISRLEFGNLMGTLNPEMFSDESNVEALLNGVDSDADGFISYPELVRWIHGGGDTPRELMDGIDGLLETGRRKRCKYGPRCKRTSPQHLRGLCHPGDWDWDLEGDEAEGLDEHSSRGEHESEAPTNAVVGPCPESELEPPSYWTDGGDFALVEVTDEVFKTVQALASATYKHVRTRDRERGEEMPTGMDVVKVLRVENIPLWRRYAEFRYRTEKKRPHKCTPCARIAGEPVKTDVADTPMASRLREGVNEVYLWHGCSHEAVAGITEGGFSLSLAGTGAGSMYGNGVYLAECSSKSDEYAQEGEGDDAGVFPLLLCRGTLGELLKMTQGGQATHLMVEAAISCGSYDSVLGDREASVGTYREFVCYAEPQVYPEYVAYYRRSFYVEPPPMPDEVLPEKVPQTLTAVLRAPGRPEWRGPFAVSTDLLHGTLQFTRPDGSRLGADSRREKWQVFVPGGAAEPRFEAAYEGPLPPCLGWSGAGAAGPDEEMEIEYPRPKPPPLRRGYIENVATGLVMDIPGMNRNRGVNVNTWTKNGGQNQLWTLTPEGKIKSALNGLVLGVGGYRKNRGQLVVTWNDGGADKFWELTPQGVLESKWCGLAMGIGNARRSRGGQIVTWNSAPDWDKVWRFVEHPMG
mmetsp:Transcript_14633/g.43724  ORF Transcript_14633/g.43724 Transcript_14633/m.43724 type:complete len:657 (+) Transcript_14633:67-2037(+)|eukprot:CAMPEP_0175251152 /NCGR_PEP_ID=MMETSP0093-20121207/35518_1 /TAXON_ID=311494 /ORGANISM="Alexandrium monilatum, Strain CCMP3105" /LENGTH=656 /DNA_ID=CAMNT_0016545413 /DNA_START=50 /DNA_END=2020 /DNA_ORIENTATION=+